MEKCHAGGGEGVQGRYAYQRLLAGDAVVEGISFNFLGMLNRLVGGSKVRKRNDEIGMTEHVAD